MLEQLTQFIEKLKSDRKLSDYSEDKVKQGIILPMLQLLGWDPFDIDEVNPEYSVSNRRVDYALRIKRANRFFIEAKNLAEELERHQEQLLEYSYREGVELAALTNGITWWFYLPTEKGNWQDRKFYTVDIQEQNTSDIANKLIDILSKDKVENGQALKYAEEIYKGKRKKKQIEETIPEAWNKIISEPDTLLVDLLVETTGKLCRFTPDDGTVKEFFCSHQDKLLLTKADVVGVEARSRRPSQVAAERTLTERMGRKSAAPTERTGHRELGRKGFRQIHDYIVPVIVMMMRQGISHTEAFRKRAEALDVAYQTVQNQCTRVLHIDTREFKTRVSDRTIVSLLKRRYPHEADVIDKELAGR